MKYLLILLALLALAAWWLGTRRRAVRDEVRRDRKLQPTDLVRCPKCGTYAARGEHACG
ncbi:hypothetical protein sos41_33270 [Alphaproteobacteria bacterium SO-S41]|nr:hypothetical protein sos41_33270 [Alphaproteobacteria bacterium SO-S41]